MNAQTATSRVRVPAFRCNYLTPSKHVPDLNEDARTGLLNRPRSLPPKYFYDAKGSELFDRICDTPEYYPTRVESSLLRRCSKVIVETAKPDCIVELGSGTSRKTRHLFDACEDLNYCPDYWPMDVCEPMLRETAAALDEEYTWLEINAFIADYHAGFGHFSTPNGHTLYTFLGGTIGNFEHPAAVALLGELRGLMQSGDYLLLGFDRVKDTRVLEAAYNDTKGVTAEFNLNLLQVLNRSLQADFAKQQFKHKAIYNDEKERVEMYLISQSDQRVNLHQLDEVLHFQEGEKILTEISRKFTPGSIKRLLAESGLQGVNHYQAESAYYSLMLAQAR